MHCLFLDNGEKCCREKGVPDVCFGYCEKDRTTEQRQGMKTGICDKWFEAIGKCLQGIPFLSISNFIE